MKHEIDIQREFSCDVCVVGGGTAGVFAAISAARIGARVVLIEKNPRLGGTVTAGGVNYPGLFFAWGKQIIGGPCFESIERTIALGGARMPKISYRPAHHWLEQILLDKLTYTKVLNDMCREAGVTVWTNAMIAAATEGDGGLALLITDKAGLLSLKAKTAVDSTGDATLITLLGYPTEHSEIQQPATPDNHLSGYEYSDIDLADLEAKWAASPFILRTPMEKIKNYLEIHKINFHVPSVKAETPEGRALVEETAVEDLFAYVRELRRVRGLENLVMDRLADETGVRETVRIVGEHRITVEEYQSGKDFEDAICYAFYPVDLHVAKGIEITQLADNVLPKIPYRALIPKGADRVLAAGRCLASDTYANSALRVQAPCMAMGQAAGVAAALSAKSGESVRSLAVSDIQNGLSSIGAIVP